MLSCPGLTSSQSPPAIYFAGLPLHLMYKHADVKAVEKMKRAKPSQFSRPRMPAPAPAKHEAINLMVYTLDVLYWMFGGYRS